MKSLKSIFALALIMLVAASCGKKDDAAAANAGKSETASLSEDAKAFVGIWEYSKGFVVEKLVLTLKADGKYEIEYYLKLDYDIPIAKVATAGGTWNVTSTDIKRNVTDENGNTREVTEKAKVLEIKPDDSLLKLLCEEQNRERVKKSLLTELSMHFKFEDGTGSLPNVRIEEGPYRTVLKGDGYVGFKKVTESAQAPAQKQEQTAAEEASSETLSFEGTVAGKHVTGDVTLEGDTASGRYAYDGSSANMSLSGSYDSILNILSLNESYDGNNTGTWNVNYDKDAKTIYGTMVNFKGKEYKVDLKVK